MEKKRHLNDSLSYASAVVKITFFFKIFSSTFWVKNDVSTRENTVAKGQEYSSIFTCLWFNELTRMISCYDWKQKPVQRFHLVNPVLQVRKFYLNQCEMVHSFTNFFLLLYIRLNHTKKNANIWPFFYLKNLGFIAFHPVGISFLVN